MYVFIVLLVIISVSSLLAVIEFKRHQARIYSIPIRIHVNGTRGKSSVTRLIGAGLREASINTITKVTGTYPRLILNDGSEVIVHRKAEPNIIEQLSIVKFASSKKAEALVMECMALQPQYQSITEDKMIHSTIGVITNVRLDHVDVMGYSIPEIANVLGRTIPKQKPLFTSENYHPDLITRQAGRKKATTIFSDPDSISSEEMNGFSYIEHKENVALAIEVCKYLGVEREAAFKGMYKAKPDAGALTVNTINVFNKEIVFYNAFAANDSHSTFKIWTILRNEIGFKDRRIVILNTRQDRMDRAEQLSEMLGQKIADDFDYAFLIGQSTDVVENILLSNGIQRSKILNLGWVEPVAIFEKILSFTENKSSVIAIGNMGGIGGKLVEYFKNRSNGNG